MNDNLKIKSRYIFKVNDKYIFIKGYVKKEGEAITFFPYGINNLGFVKKKTRLKLINKGVESLDKLKELVPEFERCIIDYKNIGEKETYITSYNFDDGDSVHITIEPWLLEELKKMLYSKIKEYESTIDDKTRSEKLGLIQPNLSSLISEIILNQIFTEVYNEKHNETI